jgi:hypothetical protein
LIAAFEKSGSGAAHEAGSGKKANAWILRPGY